MPWADIEKQRKYNRERVAASRAAYLKDKSCVKCGSLERLEIDHVDPSTKISHRIWSWTPLRREAELEKCQVLCRKCHIAKTAIERTKPLIHGTETAYCQKNCRCRECMDAHNLRKLNYRHKRRQAGLSYS